MLRFYLVYEGCPFFIGSRSNIFSWELSSTATGASIWWLMPWTRQTMEDTFVNIKAKDSGMLKSSHHFMDLMNGTYGDHNYYRSSKLEYNIVRLRDGNDDDAPLRGHCCLPSWVLSDVLYLCGVRIIALYFMFNKITHLKLMEDVLRARFVTSYSLSFWEWL